MMIPLLAYASTYRVLAVVMIVAVLGFLAMTTGLKRPIEADGEDSAWRGQVPHHECRTKRS